VSPPYRDSSLGRAPCTENAIGHFEFLELEFHIARRSKGAQNRHILFYFVNLISGCELRELLE
jgi:hypothetical protein